MCLNKKLKTTKLLILSIFLHLDDDIWIHPHKIYGGRGYDQQACPKAGLNVPMPWLTRHA